MYRRVPPRVARLQARQAQPLDAAVEPAAPPSLGHDARAAPQMNRQERVIFTVYVVMGSQIVLFLAGTGMAWWLSR
jgi:hypothetical protein